MKNLKIGTTYSVAAILAMSCGGADVTQFASEAELASAVEDAELGPVRAQMSVENGDLLVRLSNSSAFDATLSLSLNVDTPHTHATSELGEARLEAGEERLEVFSSAQIEGFDPAGTEWLRAELRYRFELDDGEAGLMLTALAVREGSVMPRAEAIELGYQLPDMLLDDTVLDDTVPEGTPTMEKAGTFKMCFDNPFQFKAEGFPNDGLSPNLATAGPWPFRGQVVYASYPSTSTSIVVKELDSAGCTTLTRDTSQGNNWKFRLLAYGGAATSGFTSVAFALDNSGVTPFLDKVVTVPTSGDPARVSVTFTPAAHQELYTGTFLAVNTLRRATSILGLTQPSSFLRVSPTVRTGSAATTAYYCHTVNAECPTDKTIRLGSDSDGLSRSTVAHETGHYIHAWYATPPFNYTYSPADADAANLPNDNCDFRRTASGHHQLSIEWQSAAHNEGLANFIGAVTYNLTSQTDCSVGIEGEANLNCEAVGMTIKGNGTSTLCSEWNNPTQLNKVGNEFDWTKMYWDFITNQGGSFATYMQAEKNAGALPIKGDHFGPIRTALQALDSTQATKLSNAAKGNIVEGAAQ